VRKLRFISILILTAVSTGAMFRASAETLLGYTDTPMLPSGKWHVHDPNRPKPVVVAPAATFSQEAPAPSDAIVLFNGRDLSQWEGSNGVPQWTTQGDYMQVKAGSGYIRTKEKFGDFQLHLEFAEPTETNDPGNSGVYLQGVYEVQVYKSDENPIYADGRCGALYGQSAPMVSACKKPGEWQTFDIIFEAARWNENHTLVRPAIVTVIYNGILIHYKQRLLGPTGHRILANYDTELPATAPISLQDHGDPVRFRNIWVRNIQEEENP
jgi:hypothetical protein